MEDSSPDSKAKRCRNDGRLTGNVLLDDPTRRVLENAAPSCIPDDPFTEVSNQLTLCSSVLSLG